MDITLDSTEKLISVFLAGASIAAFLFRKIIAPYLKRLWGIISKWFALINLTKKFEIKLECLDSLLSIHQHKLQLLLNEFSLGIYECNVNGACVWTNTALQSLFGLEESDMLNDQWLTVLHPDDIAPTYKRWHETVTSWVPYKARYRIINPVNKQEIFCETEAIPIKNSQNSIVGYFGWVKAV